LALGQVISSVFEAFWLAEPFFSISIKSVLTVKNVSHLKTWPRANN
jgi:hypothetical protein